MGPSCSEDVFLSSSLIDMYSKCGIMLDARSVFDEMPRRGNALILGYVENGESEVALEFFGKMGLLADFRCCCQGLLVDMYSKCGRGDARMVFESMPRRDVVLRTSLIQTTGKASWLSCSSKLSGCCPNSRTYVAALATCARSAMREEAVDVDGKLVKRKSLETGVAIHGEASNNRCCEDVFVGNTLIDMYAKCGKLEEARKAWLAETWFRGTQRSRDLLEVETARWPWSWSSAWLGRTIRTRERYVDNGESELGLELLESMDCAPNSQTLVVRLTACGNVGSSEAGRKIQAELYSVGWKTTMLWGSAWIRPGEDGVRSRLSRSSLLAATATWLNEAGSFSRQWTRTLVLFAGFITTAAWWISSGVQTDWKRQ
ncbi:pentatricopeptide repeat-containing protein At3g09040, mitochondrial-like [Selaginella moellendorffii]|uniref:pentatricopeptide repeat-containing protein At3g09040, mitochondrial-like n=1 Tax=Selaginella moellendorffii TaxID=88036 RepID=UPI000D1CED6C|nr:pentatricopeptide repeat-containing protein At3g09040, mitochondrial-like [Selaginella moellendorffii]|eukprot:XP_024533204.1 pentatricopeptide repeat-containing protein At3g09040, mitochondrial-like [Selaginella moellendorffii]